MNILLSFHKPTTIQLISKSLFTISSPKLVSLSPFKLFPYKILFFNYTEACVLLFLKKINKIIHNHHHNHNRNKLICISIKKIINCIFLLLTILNNLLIFIIINLKISFSFNINFILIFISLKKIKFISIFLLIKQFYLSYFLII